MDYQGRYRIFYTTTENFNLELIHFALVSGKGSNNTSVMLIYLFILVSIS